MVPEKFERQMKMGHISANLFIYRIDQEVTLLEKIEYEMRIDAKEWAEILALCH